MGKLADMWRTPLEGCLDHFHCAFRPSRAQSEIYTQPQRGISAGTLQPASDDPLGPETRKVLESVLIVVIVPRCVCEESKGVHLCATM
jgi:hypothetical protein